jgi:hypothetical protein
MALGEDKYGDIGAEISSWQAHLDNELAAAQRAYNEIVKLAKTELQLSPFEAVSTEHI